MLREILIYLGGRSSGRLEEASKLQASDSLTGDSNRFEGDYSPETKYMQWGLQLQQLCDSYGYSISQCETIHTVNSIDNHLCS